jgi:alginate O-acetyltransferase complex protein AlgI
MLFSSLIFLFSYLPFLLIGNYLWRNRKWQNVLLFIGSLFFYAWGEKEKVFVMLGSILVNYLIGLLIDKATTSSLKKRRLAIGIVINLGVLVYFKYAAFLVENCIDFMANFGLVIEQHIRFEKLPIGISFYTFQSISYLIDVYRKETPAQKDFIKLGLYIALFPQLIAGPIIRYVDISKQLLDRQHSLAKFNDGIKRFISGLGKKLILANSLAYPVDEILALPADEIGTALAWTAMLGYTLQIYFDFSGYSDMAIGLGKMFGFTIPENFNYPFISKSIREFWNRWHISLSTWFKDYLYIPLGGNRKGKVVTMRNLIIVFLITGLWHGASWSFIAWGLLHGIFMIAERLGLGKSLEKAPSWLQNAYALFVVVLAFVWFRVENIHDALIIQKSMFGFSGGEANFYAIDMFTNAYFWTIFVFAIAASVPWKKAVARFTSLGNRATNAFRLATALFYGLVFLLSILAMVNSTYSPFIYFRF